MLEYVFVITKAFPHLLIHCCDWTSVALIHDLLYANDCDHVTYSERDLQLLMDRFSITCDEFRLTINLKKTVAMLQPTLGKLHPTIDIQLEVVDTFVYLSNTLSRSNAFD